MRRLCQGVCWAFLVLYFLALAALAIGTFGLFGAERDPLSGVFLIPLGLPWNRFIDSFSEPLWSWLAAAAPAINLLFLRIFCRLFAVRR